MIDCIEKRLKIVLDGQPVLIDGTSGENVVLGEDLDADCTISMSMDTFGKLQRKEIKPFLATMTGKIKVKGDIGLAQKLKQITY